MCKPYKTAMSDWIMGYLSVPSIWLLLSNLNFGNMLRMPPYLRVNTYVNVVLDRRRMWSGDWRVRWPRASCLGSACCQASVLPLWCCFSYCTSSYSSSATEERTRTPPFDSVLISGLHSPRGAWSRARNAGIIWHLTIPFHWQMYGNVSHVRKPLRHVQGTYNI